MAGAAEKPVTAVAARTSAPMLFFKYVIFATPCFFSGFGPRAANRRFVLLTIGLWTPAIAPKLNAIVIVRSSLGAKQ